ncbi:MAG: cytochrome c1 [Proteobacteria bacterium]|nr:cytochrome c1 [Pseudomonadota bacterium]
MRKILITLFLASACMANASTEGPALDKAPVDLRNVESLQRGAQTFTNYCLSCHSAVSMRYNRLTAIGLTEEQIKAHLVPADGKVGDVMKSAMTAQDAKEWFGAPPPDLSVIARARGADWLYTYLRSFYRDETRPSGWNNTVFDKVGMPHVLYELQGEQVLEIKKEGEHEIHALKLVKPGLLTKTGDNGEYDQSDYNQRVGDLVNYLVFMSEPSQVKREQIGYAVLLFLIFVLVPLSWMLKKEYWRDVK